MIRPLRPTPDSIELRPAEGADEGLLLEWRNDPGTRRASFNTAEVSPAEHRRWLHARLRDPRSRLFVAELAGDPIGQVRLDKHDDRTTEVHVSIAPAARGRGLAAPVLQLAVVTAGRVFSAERVVAHVKPDNAASLRAFLRAGFAETSRQHHVVELVAPVAGRDPRLG